MNVIKDVEFTGTIKQQIDKAVEYLGTQISEHTYLGSKGFFVTDEEYPAFVRQEIIVNAACHRDYSVHGTDTQVKMFTNRLVVESPGTLPGRVRPDNIRHTHFSRNPRIAQFLKAYNYVKEFGEGVDRMCRELEAADCGDIIFFPYAFMLRATAMNRIGHAQSDNERLGTSIMKDSSNNERLEAPIMNDSPKSDPLEETKVALSPKSDPLDEAKVALSPKSDPLDEAKVALSPKSNPLDEAKVALSPKSDTLEDTKVILSPKSDTFISDTGLKLELNGFYSEYADYSNKEEKILMLAQILEGKLFNQPTKIHILNLYKHIANNEVFGRKEIIAILSCSITTGRRLLNVLKSLDLIIPIKGNGKGRYMFKDISGR